MSRPEFDTFLDDAYSCELSQACKDALWQEWQDQCGFLDDNPTPIEGPLPPPGDCGVRFDTLSAPSSGAPVDLFFGDKVETAVDMRVRLTGLDFSVGREYTSNLDYSSSALVGNHWTSSLFRIFRLREEEEDECSLCWGGFALGGYCVDFSCNPLSPIPVGGPTAQYFEKAIVNLNGTDYPVWRLVEPGQSEMDFYRQWNLSDGSATAPDPPNIGRIAAVRDMYGNTWEYEYTNLSDGFTRLSKIDLKDQSGASQGVVDFTWDTDTESVNTGKLTDIVVSRPDATGAPVETQSVVYTYMDELNTSFEEDLGTDGDLIQVTRSTRVDTDPGPPPVGDPVWRVRITQYRYHGNLGESDGAREFIWEGGTNQLKMVISPEQIEYAAQKYNAANPDLSLEDFAASLLLKADDDPVFTGSQLLLVDLAAKIVEEYEPAPGDRRVETQYVQSACGCGGGSTQGLKLTYDYFPWGSGDGQTTKVTEWFKDGAAWTLHRTLHHDTELKGSAPAPPAPDTRAPYLVTKAIIDGTKQWVTHYVYDANDRNLVRMMTPSARLTYTPADPNPPSYTAHSDQGLVYAYAYDTNNYRTEVRLAKGFKDTSETDLDDSLYTLISRTAYGDGTGDTRIYLPNKAEAIRVEGANPDDPGDAEKVEVVDYAYGFHTTGEDDIAWVETKVETERESENGPEVTYSSYQLYDNASKNYWSIAADGSYTKRVFDIDDINSVSMTGQVIRIIRNADKIGDSFPTSGVPTTTPADRNADGESLTTEYVRDLLGRIQERVTPGQVSTYTLREMRDFPDRPKLKYYAELTLPHELSPGVEYDGPGTITWYNADDDAIGSSDYEIASGYTFALPPIQQNGYTLVVSNYDLDGDDVGETGQLARSIVEHDVSGLVTAQKAWHSIAGFGAGQGVYTTSYAYDALGRVLTTTNPVNTVTRNTYDVLDRVIQVEVGTDAISPVPVAEYFYDHTGGEGSPAQGDDNGNLTLVRQHVDDDGSSSWRVTVNTFDFRDRLVIVKNPIAPHEAIAYDNLDRVTHRGVFSTVPANNDFSPPVASRERVVRTDYSQRGLAYKQSVAINPTSDAGSRTYLETNTWVDEVGRAIETWPPNGPATKTTYDGLGRAVIVYVTDRHDDADPGAANNYANVYDSMGHKAKVDGDVILEQTTYRYVDGSSQGPHSGMLDLMTARLRTHDADDTKTGDLADFTDPDDKLVITTYAGTFYDDADRTIRSVNYGTNDSLDRFFWDTTAPTIDQSNPPVWTTGAELVTATTYNVRGLVDTSTDPENQVTKYFYDDLNRRKANVENQIDLDEFDIAWDPTNLRWKVTDGLDPGAPDDDRVTSFVYDGISNVIKQVAHLPGPTPGGEGTVQVTEYVYGVTTLDTPGPSGLASNDLLRKVIYPEESAGSPLEPERTVFSAYNRQSELIYMKDQNATEHDYDRDDLGRVTKDQATIPLGSDIDGAIQAITTTYTTYGLVETVKSLNGAIQNAVKFEYNGLWQITDVWQEPDDDIDANSLRVTYTYATKQRALGNYSRVDFITYPDGAGVGSFYGMAGTSDDRISRIVGVRNGTSLVHQLFVIYERIGLNMFAVADYIKPDVQLDRTASHTGERQTSGFTDNPGLYPGFDRFGRVVRQMWVDGDFTTHLTDNTVPKIPPIVELAYTYDKASNRTTALDERPAAKQKLSHKYGYDGLDRLIDAKRGSWINQTFDADQYTQQWDLDMLGNWDVVRTDLDGNEAFEPSEVEPRNHNDVNELNDRDPDGSGGNNPLNLTYDKAGNLRTEQVGDGSTTVTYTHDAWNRLVKVEYGNDSRGEYEYNGLNWRIIKRADTDLDGTLDQQRIMYYSAGWQLLEERIDDDPSFTPDPGSADVDRHVQHMWGPRYIDDIILHREDINKDGTYDDTWYHLTDVQFSTVAVIDDSAGLTERVTYTAYGVARHHYMADVDGDGDVDATELADIRNTASGPNHAIGQANYDVDQDIDRDGDVTITDYNIARTENTHPALALGLISDPGVDNQIGWDGYVFNAETLQYHVRHRCYSPTLGRWLERDPVGYLDQMNLYVYTSSNPISRVDPLGLQRMQPFQSSGQPSCTPCPPSKRRSSGQCCSDAYKKGLHKDPKTGTPSGGGTICCDGRQVACNWTYSKNRPWQKIIEKCVTQHELDHLDDIDCPKGCGLSRPGFKPGKNPNKEECKAYAIELTCTKRSVSECANPPATPSEIKDCVRRVTARIIQIRKEMRRRGCKNIK